MTDRSLAIATLIAAVVLLGVVFVGTLRRPAAYARLAAGEPVTCRIDPNLADAPTLCLLPTIGPPTADRILRDRAAHGPFATAADLERVPYIGVKTRAAIEPWLVFDDPADPQSEKP